MQKIQLRSMVFIFFRLLIREFLIIRQDFIFKIRVGLWIADNKERFDYMKQHKTEIEAVMGMALSWERLDNKKSSLICTYIKGLDFKNQENYPELMNKSIDLVVKMRDVLKEYVLAEL